MAELKHIYKTINIPINEERISSYAKKYIKLRSNIIGDSEDFDNHPIFKNLDFNTELIRKKIIKHTTPERNSKQVFRDIYRSDLGELILVTYFDHTFPEDGEGTYVIPLKNIWDRELNNLPGRGIDTTGYKEISEDKIELLLGEAKVSGQQKNPPDVVHVSSDSIYASQTKLKDKDFLLKRLANLSKKLNPSDAVYFNAVIVALDTGLKDCFEIVYGCCLVRDSSCLDTERDFGKLRDNVSEFEPGKVHFVIPNFDKSIDDTVDLFYDKVQELSGNN